MSTRSGRIRPSTVEASPPRTVRKGVSPPRSPARNRKTSPPARSPARKSPARKSPARKTTTTATANSKFPARKSPSRTTKEANSSPAKSPTKRSAIKNIVTVGLEDVSKGDVYRSTARVRRSEYSIKDFTSTRGLHEIGSGDKFNGVDSREFSLRNRKAGEDVQPPRRSGRIKEFVDTAIKRSPSKSVSKSISQSIETISDEDVDSEVELSKSKSASRKLATPVRDSSQNLALISSRWEFGGRIGSAALLVLIPLTVFAVLASCRRICSIKVLSDLSVFKSVSLWYSPLAISVVAIQYVIQAVIAHLPILGTKADKMDDSGKKYSFNALFSSIFTIGLLFSLDYLKVLNSDTFLKDYLKLAAASYVFAVVLSIILYVKTRNQEDSELNPYGNTGYVLYDYFIGREIHPQIRHLDVKIWISRICNINTLILAILIFKHGFILPANMSQDKSLESYQDILTKIQYKPTILLFSLMQVVYILNFIMREYKITTTFYWQSEGVGYLQTVASALYPFYFTTIGKFVADSGVALSTNTLIAASVLYLVGFVLMLASNNIKYEFRKNPLHPSLTHLESMPTFHGKKLLISNVWGKLRHPNYTGDILIHIALALPGLLTGELVAAAPALLTILVLLHRSWRDHARCRRRYGAAWDRYCKRVPSVIAPKVF